MAMGAARKSRRGGFRDINITPLVDVMLGARDRVQWSRAPLLTTGLRINLPEVHRRAKHPVKDARLLVTVGPRTRRLCSARKT